MNTNKRVKKYGDSAEAKEKYWSKKCEEIKQLERIYDSFNYLKKIKEVSGAYRISSPVLIGYQSKAIYTMTVEEL